MDRILCVVVKMFVVSLDAFMLFVVNIVIGCTWRSRRPENCQKLDKCSLVGNGDTNVHLETFSFGQSCCWSALSTEPKKLSEISQRKTNCILLQTQAKNGNRSKLLPKV